MVWDKSVKDTVGLQQFFDAHKKQYVLPKRYEILLVQVNDKKAAKNILQDLKEGKDSKYLKDKYKEYKPIIKQKTYNADDAFVKKYDLENTPEVLYKDNSDYVVLSLLKLIPEGTPELKQVRGKVTNDYQQYLEQQWLQDIKKKYPVKINKKTWKKLRAKYKK